MPDCGLIVFLRFPVKGKIKTRLAATLGDEAALNIYHELSTLALHVASDTEMPVYLFYDGQVPLEKEKNSFHYILQSEGDLGEKMQNAIDYVLSHHTKAIIIGSDCPCLSPADILESDRLLDRHDIVVGPADDGGYYLLACKENFNFLFQNIRWGTSSVFEETITRIRQHNKSYCLLRTLNDIDTEEDWIKFVESNKPS